MTAARRAAGGVVWRPEGDGVRVALVHRPRYDDWSLPKGKLNPQENALVAAVREVYEETGVRAVPQVRLPGARYPTDEAGAEKSVDYWSMRARGDDREPGDDEVDVVRWVPPDEAARLLSYASDRRVVYAFAELPAVTSVVVVVRHARAGSRADWRRPDSERPLDALGEAQVAALTPVLDLFAPSRLVSAPPLRCRATVAPLAADRRPVEVEAVLGEEARAQPEVVAGGGGA
ncbi:MAG TPA: NUDIX hydrolase, partial [Micromonosporaceae bacterium]